MTGVQTCALPIYAMFYSEFCLAGDTGSKVLWGEKDKNSNLTLTVTPLEIQKLLARHIYDAVPSVIMTSATLSTGNDENGFAFFNR